LSAAIADGRTDAASRANTARGGDDPRYIIVIETRVVGKGMCADFLLSLKVVDVAGDQREKGRGIARRNVGTNAEKGDPNRPITRGHLQTSCSPLITTIGLASFGGQQNVTLTSGARGEKGDY
jgi:hypothetical protein